VLERKLHTKIMQKMHDAPMAGHCGENTTRELLGKTFYWPEMKEDIEQYVHTCEVPKCQVGTQEVWAV